MKLFRINLIILFFVFMFTLSALICGIAQTGNAGTRAYRNPINPAVHISVLPQPMYEDLWKVENVEEAILVGAKASSSDTKYRGTEEEAGFLVENHGCGRILIFPNRKKAMTAHKEIMELNDSGKEHSWSFSKDNVVLLLDSGFPEAEARELEEKLYEIKELANLED